MIPVFVLLSCLPWFEKRIIQPYVRDHKSQDQSKIIKFYLWYRDRTEHKYSSRFKKLGALALVTFVAIPLPITGAWTGTLAAYIFRIPPKKALPLIFAGVLVAGVVFRGPPAEMGPVTEEALEGAPAAGKYGCYRPAGGYQGIVPVYRGQFPGREGKSIEVGDPVPGGR